MNICLFTQQEISSPLSIDDERASHILKVLHKNVDDSFDAGIIGGASGEALITLIDDKAIHFKFTPTGRGKTLFPLTLIVGFPRPIQLRRLLRDAAGLGVKKIILSGTQLGEKSYMESNIFKDGSADKMLLDGTAQAASTHIPELVLVKTLNQAIELVENEKSVHSKIALDNKNPKTSLHDFLEKEGANCYVAAIGSERGWSDKERDLLELNGFTLCSMGKRILRTETAVTVASSIILDFMGVLN